MKKHYFLGLAANYSRDERRAHLYKVGRKEDLKDLREYLIRKYEGEEAILAKNGRSALAMALKAYFKKDDKILVNGFTCYAVYEAVRAAGLKPVFVDISKDDLNFNLDTVADTLESSDSHGKIRGIIVQNTLGNPINIKKIEKFAKKYDLTIIEDLAHCAGMKYADGREIGTVGAAVALSFGKEKAIDTVSGGAVVFRSEAFAEAKVAKAPRLSDHLRARFYPTLGSMCRKLSYVHLGGVFMRLLLKIHWVERSADNKLDLERRCSKFEAGLALMQLKGLRRGRKKPIREFYFVKDRKAVLEKLKAAGYYFDGFWYEKPVSPERYYKKVHFPEKECPNSMWVAEHIINVPTYYKKKDLQPALKIIKENLENEK